MPKTCRGYISSRPFEGNWVPQHIQNIIIRNYCQINDLHYLLSAAEYAIDKCYMVLCDLVVESKNLSGIVLYSMHQLPSDERYRNDICNGIISNNCSIYMCVEEKIVHNHNDLSDLNTILNIHRVMSKCLQSI